MTDLQKAIKYIEGLVERRAGVFSEPDTTILTLQDATHVLSLLVTHAAKEDTLQFDMDNDNIDCFGL